MRKYIIQDGDPEWGFYYFSKTADFQIDFLSK